MLQSKARQNALLHCCGEGWIARRPPALPQLGIAYSFVAATALSRTGCVAPRRQWTPEFLREPAVALAAQDRGVVHDIINWSLPRRRIRQQYQSGRNIVAMDLIHEPVILRI